MNKKLLVIITVLIGIVMLFSGCGENYNWGPISGENYSDKIVTGNGGMAVTQGNYLYFINGVTSYEGDNTFGKVVKGAIMRHTLDENGKIVGEAETIVPKKVFCSSQNAGMYVYGEWIYYVTPTNVKDSEGVVQTDYIEFMRTKVDGTSTQMVFKLKGNSTEYAFSKDALCYYSESALYTVKLDGKGESKLIADEITSCVFPREGEDNPALTTKDGDQYVYYTKKSEVTTDTNNELWVASMDGSFNEKMIGKLSYFSAEEQAKFENLTDASQYPDYTKVYTFTIKKYEDGVLYYSKSYTENSSAVDVGIYAYNVENDYLNASEVKFDPAKEKKYSSSTYTSVYTFGDADKIIVSDDSKLWMVSATTKEEVFATSVKVISVIKTAESEYVMYYTKTDANDVYKFKITSIAENKESAVKVTISTPDVSWLNIEQTGNYIFYVNPAYKYVHRIDLTAEYESEGYDVMLGKYNAEDLEKIEEAE